MKSIRSKQLLAMLFAATTIFSLQTSSSYAIDSTEQQIQGITKGYLPVGTEQTKLSGPNDSMTFSPSDNLTQAEKNKLRADLKRLHAMFPWKQHVDSDLVILVNAKSRMSQAELDAIKGFRFIDLDVAIKGRQKPDFRFAAATEIAKSFLPDKATKQSQLLWMRENGFEELANKNKGLEFPIRKLLFPKLFDGPELTSTQRTDLALIIE